MVGSVPLCFLHLVLQGKGVLREKRPETRVGKENVSAPAPGDTSPTAEASHLSGKKTKKIYRGRLKRPGNEKGSTWRGEAMHACG